MPNPNGGLFSALFTFCANASEQMCPSCYRCDSYSPGVGCTNCVYDKTYCTHDCPVGQFWNEALQKCVQESLGGDCGDVVCADPYVLNITTCTCECPETDLECKDGYTYSTEICGCVKDACDDGYYWAGLVGCKKCPEYNESTTGSLMSCGVHSSNKGANGQSDCYKKAIVSLRLGPCQYSDETGSYEFTNNCYYSDSIDIGPGKPIIGGGDLGDLTIDP